MKSTGLFRIVSILAAVGITLAIYLLWQQFFKPSFSPCNINATVNCDAIISGPVSKTLGIPTPLIGLLGYIFVLIGGLRKNKKLVLAMSSFGLLFCLYIAYIELFILDVVCPVCLICQLDMLSVFTISVFLNLKKKND